MAGPVRFPDSSIEGLVPLLFSVTPVTAVSPAGAPPVCLRPPVLHDPCLKVDAATVSMVNWP
jgi:hypothetical protein